MNDRKVILFDGVCNLCNSSVNFVIDRDKKNVFSFASLQSEAARELMKETGMPYTDMESVVLVDGKQTYFKSDAVIRICQILGGAWKVFSIFKVLPRSLRDLLYDLVAKNRYAIFGKRDTCRVPTPELQGKFLS
jgi:predicted DCC family thiol-disulfide oxidoreductase YuxK